MSGSEQSPQSRQWNIVNFGSLLGYVSGSPHCRRPRVDALKERPASVEQRGLGVKDPPVHLTAQAVACWDGQISTRLSPLGLEDRSDSTFV